MIKLHLGCAWRNFGSDWIHIDGGEYDHVMFNNITKLAFPDNSVDLIYASHVLEYFDREEAEKVLKEWCRVLKPGATIRLAVPDFCAMAELYLKGYPLKTFLGPLYGKMNMGMKGNRPRDTIYHKTAYDFYDLVDILIICGFESIERYDWRTTPPHDKFDDHSQSYVPREDFVPTKERPFDKDGGYLISLNVEGKKK